MSNRRMSYSNRMRALWAGLLALAFPVIAIVGTMSAPGVQPVAVAQVAGGTATPGAASRPVRTFQQVKMQADRVVSALDALIMWQTFIESGVTGEELAKGEEELKIWQERVDDDAVIINKKWVGGKDKKATEERVNSLIQEFQALTKASKMVEGIAKLRDAAKIWPENFSVQFYLGLIALEKEDFKESSRYFEACSRLAPNSPAVLNNLGASYAIQGAITRQQSAVERGVMTLVKSVKAKDTKENVQNLITAMALVNPNALRAPRYKEARDLANLLGGRHGINGPAQGFARMDQRSDAGVDVGEGTGPKDGGVSGSGSGFVISADGYIITNKHVAAGGNSTMVKFTDGTQRIAEIVVIDDEYDLALLKVKTNSPMSYVQLAASDNPPDGSDIVIMGYPAPSRFGYTVKTTKGIVTSGNNQSQGGYDITVDAKANPGNSGGPIFNGSGHVVGVLSAGTLVDERIINSYSLAVSAGRVRKFLSKNNITVTPGEELESPLTSQQISERNRMATVCVLVVGKGEAP